jgi:hypothetical protein
MTRVEFEFYGPDGSAYKNKAFIIKLANAGFVQYQDGVILPDTIYAATDEFGKAIVEIMPSSTPYFVHVLSDEISYNDCCVPDLARFKFYVPVSADIVRAQDLFIEVPPTTTAYDEEAIRLITEAKVAAVNAAVAAAASAVKAEDFAQSIAGDAQSARDSAADALISKNAAAGSATAASNSATSASASAAASLASKDAAGVSAAAALVSQNAAKTSETNSKTSETNAKTSETNAATSRTNAANSATAAGTSATNAANSATTASTAATTATTKASEASTSAGNALTEANRAKTEADRAASSLASKQDANVNLTAFSGLVGVVDRLPYFTGAGALSLATLTSKARSLLARTDTAGMQAEIGVVPVSSMTDRTAGRFLVPGWLGLGDALAITAGQDYNTLVQPGEYFYGSGTAPSNAPVAATHFIKVIGRSLYPHQEVRVLYSNDVYTRSAKVTNPTAAAADWNSWVLNVKAGDFGLGNALNPWATDANTINVTRMFSYGSGTTANIPAGADFGEGLIVFGPSLNEANALFMNHDTDRAFIKRKRVGVWQTGYELHTTSNSQLDPSLGTGGLLSTAVVSGFRVEKYVNGTMCLTGKVSLASQPVNSNAYQTLTLPVTFFNTANMIPQLTCNASQAADIYGVTFQRAATTSSILYAVRNGATTAQTFEINVCVWGTWK